MSNLPSSSSGTHVGPLAGALLLLASLGCSDPDDGTVGMPASPGATTPGATPGATTPGATPEATTPGATPGATTPGATGPGVAPSAQGTPAVPSVAPAPTETAPSPEPSVPMPVMTTPADTGTGPSTDGPPPPTFAEAASFLEGTCGTPECHGRTTPPLLLNDAELANTLRSTTVERCGGAPLVAPGNAQGSAIYMVVQGQCGDALVMPQGCGVAPCLAEDTMASLVAWLSAPDPFL